jgi:hypothetical protein
MMNRRTVVTIQQDFEGQIRFWLDSPSTIKDADKPLTFACRPEDLPPWTQPEAVLNHGRAILNALREHPAVSEALAQALQPGEKEARPLYFHLRVEEAEQICWETLCDEKGRFLALNARWPIARIAQSDQPPAIRSLAAPLRVMALLSAIGVQAKREWNALRDAYKEARKAGLDCQLHVFVGEEALQKAIGNEIANLPGVQVSGMVEDAARLRDQLAEIQPHILHFFCHGVADFGLSQLELATLLDWAQNRTRGSLQLDLAEMAAWPELSRIWLVTLNCCKSGQGDSGQQSMAYKLVSNGVPAAVGMREPVDALDAHTFCGRFYESLFAKLLQVKEKLAAQSPEETTGIEWAEALWAARVALAKRADRKRRQDREWALPVLYVQRDPFLVRQPQVALNANQITRLVEVSRILRSLPEGTPQPVRQEILAMLDVDIPPTLRPDIFGRLPGETTP